MDPQQEKSEALACWYLTGATAVGKTSVSLELARRLNAEIVGLDSMTIYRGMDIGTAKPERSQREQVPHHLIDIADPCDSFSVSQYRDLALATIREIRSRGKEVLFVGGSALYLKALLRGLADGPPADLEFRQAMETELAGLENSQLHQRLALLDPLTAHRLHVNDRRRIIRALEVHRATGQPISHSQMEFEEATPAGQCRVFCLRRPRGELHQRIEQRVQQMFDGGLVEEVTGLLARWGELGPTARQAVGYCEVIALLRGEMTAEQCRERVLIRTRRFARHQETWFRGLEECRILDFSGPEAPQRLAEQILALAESPTAPTN